MTCQSPPRRVVLLTLVILSIVMCAVHAAGANNGVKVKPKFQPKGLRMHGVESLEINEDDVRRRMHGIDDDEIPEDDVEQRRLTSCAVPQNDMLLSLP